MNTSPKYTHFSAVNKSLEDCDLSQLPSDKLAMLEADCFWCVSKLLDGIQVSVRVYVRECVCVRMLAVVNAHLLIGQLHICSTRYSATNSVVRGSGEKS